MAIVAPPGVFDILPSGSKEPWKFSHLWQYVENLIRLTSSEYGFAEVRTPIFERTELFSRCVGEETDIVSKEMYTFIDKGERSLTLRPEGTASVMRAFIENNLQQQACEHKLFYIAPMFRYERSQAGRYRQHHQFGVERIGNSSAECDAETIDLLYALFSRLQLKNLKVSINSIGTPSCRQAFKQQLVSYLKQHQSDLSADSQKRLEVNPLRILDSKDSQDKQIIASAPSIQDYLSKDAESHFTHVLSLLDLLKIPYEVNPFLVRGLDYYNKTVFEVTAGELGAQNSIGGGGRYDGLLKSLGGPDLPSFGFGVGLERLIQTMLGQQIYLPVPPSCLFFLIPLGEKAQSQSLVIAQNLRKKGVATHVELSGRKVGKAMQLANQSQAKYSAVLGDAELEKGTLEIKEMSSGKIHQINLDNMHSFFHQI